MHFNLGVKYSAYCDYKKEKAKAPMLYKAFAMARN